MRRLIPLICVLGVLLSLASPAWAVSGPVVQGEATVAKQGKYTDFTVSISGNTGLSAFILYVDCDPAVFQVDYDEEHSAYRVEQGEAFRSGTMSCNVNGTRGWVVSWYRSDGEATADGAMFTLRFLTAENAQGGNYSIGLRYSPKDTLNGDMERVELTCQPGVITVPGDTGRFYVEDCAASPGETVTVRVKTDICPGIASYMVYLLYDTSVFSPVYSEELESYEVTAGDFSTGGTILCSLYSNRGCRVAWYAPTERYEAGTLFELPLAVSEDAKPGNYPIELRISAADTTNQAGERVTVSAENATAVVGGFDWGAVTHTEEDSLHIQVTPRIVCDTWLIAASYTEGRLVDIQTKPARIKDGITTYEFDLEQGEKVQLFALRQGTLQPLDGAYPVIGND